MNKLSVFTIVIFFVSCNFLSAGDYFPTVWDQIMQEQSRKNTSAGAQAFEFKDYKQAREYFKKAVRDNPKDHNAHRMLGIANYWLGDVDSAIEEYLTALQLQPKDADSHMVLGIAYAWKKDTDAAIKEFEVVLELEPRRSDACMNLGSCYQNKGMLSKSLSNYRAAIKLDPKNPLYHFQLGLTYRLLSLNEEAKTEYSQALKLYPYYEDACLELGGIYEEEGNYAQAIYYYKKAASMKEYDLVAKLKLAVSYLANSQNEEARKVLWKSLRLTPAGDQSRLALDLAFAGDKDSKPQVSDPLEQFEKNLKNIPLDQNAEVNFEISFKTLSNNSSVEYGNTVTYNTGSGVRYKLKLANEDDLARKMKIEKFTEKIRQDLKTIPKDKNAQINMTITYDDKGSGEKTATGRSSVSKNDKIPRLVYQPRLVGNDMDLWVMGSQWVFLVEQSLESLLEQYSGKSWEYSLALACAYLQLGYAWEALDILNKLEAALPAEPLVKQALAVVYVELGEWERVELTVKELTKLKPKDPYIIQLNNWLKK